MDEIYTEYLEWFYKTAVRGMVPIGKEKLLRQFVMSDENDDGTFSAFYILFLRPSESLNGRAEFFIIEEKSLPHFGADGEIDTFTDIRYKRYTETTPSRK